MKRFASTICLLCCLGACLFLPPAVQARGPGIKAGDGRLHAGIELDLVYDTNPNYSSSTLTPDLMLRIRPSIGLDFPSEVVAFELNGKVGYDYFFGIDNKNTTDLSSVAGEADMRLGINPNGQFSFFLIDTFSRSADPRYSAISSRFDRTDNELKALFQIKPGGGALMFDLAYGFFIDWFDDTGNDARALSNYGHRVYFSGKWKFLPKTAMTVDFDADLRRFPYGYETVTMQNPDVNGIRATLGLIGQVSPSVSVIVKAGYGDTLLSGGIDSAGAAYPGAGFRSAVGQAEVNYKAGTTFIQGGYLRNFQPVALFGYFGQDRFYARLTQQIMGRLTLSADVGFDLLNYGQPLVVDIGSSGRDDYMLSGGAQVEYHFLDWLYLGLDYRLQILFSGYTQPNGANSDYNKHAVAFRVGIDY